MKKIKWEYDKVIEMHSFDNGNCVFNIKHLRNGNYSLSNYGKYIHQFRKLSTAKKVAELIYNG